MPDDTTLVVTGRRLDASGRMSFQLTPDSEPIRRIELDPDELRLSAGPPSWSIGPQITQPGCWVYRIRNDEFTDALVFEVSDPASPTPS